MFQIDRNFKAVGVEYDTIFDSVVSQEDGFASKPSPDGLLRCLEKLEVNSADSVFVGDHEVDILSGKNAGIGLKVGISHGFHSDKDLASSGADKVIHTLEEVLELL